VVDFDWSNAKEIWANNHPMNCDDLLLTQAAMVKAQGTYTRVFVSSSAPGGGWEVTQPAQGVPFPPFPPHQVYRNLVKSLPFYATVSQKLADPAYSGWFLRFANGSGGSYHVPPCDKNYDPPLCSGGFLRAGSNRKDTIPFLPHVQICTTTKTRRLGTPTVTVTARRRATVAVCHVASTCGITAMTRCPSS